MNDAERSEQRVLAVVRAIWPWLLVVVLGVVLAVFSIRYLGYQRGAESIEWKDWHAIVLVAGAGLVGIIAFHLQRRRSAAMGFSQVKLIGARGVGAWLSDLPSVFRVLAIVALAVALARPYTFRTVVHQEDSVDIMIVFDMSKSMEETDLPRDRMDAAQRVVRRFIRTTKHDRIGLVIFGQQAMLQCPLTLDTKMVEQVVADLAIGDVPELGTAIGDGLAMALASLRRSDGQCDPAPGAPNTCPDEFTCSAKGYCEGKKRNKVVIVLSDGDNNWVTRFGPDESARTAKEMGIPVYTVLVGREEGDLFGGMSVNPATLKSIAQLTGGEFFRATDYESFDKGFQVVRSKLDMTKRTRTERVPDKQLFGVFAIIAAILVALELLLSHTRLRRLP
ncbi:MAG: BatA (aerotolerance operon) [Deltaproteobacteria bacterium]|nr:BatA (aerotolerance operon) [Deltaproteobacteria bacterium]